MSPIWIWIWGGALLLYGAFALWYESWRGPLSRPEIEAHLARLAQGFEGPDPERLAALRAFLEADDGREVFVANLLQLPSEPVRHPRTGATRPAREVLEGYTRPFMRALLRRAGHPAFFGHAAGSYVEHWGVEPDPGWSLVGVVRYRSRRDLAELATSPRFDAIHPFKRAAVSRTFALPVASGFTLVGPRLAVGLALALLAALAHLALAPS